VVTGGAAIAGPWVRAVFGSAARGGGGDPDVSAGDRRARRPGVVLAGSCSEATRRQVEEFALHHPTLTLDPEALADGFDPVPVVTALADSHAGPILVASSAPPDRVAAAQASLGRERASAAVETAFARCAIALYAGGVRRFVVAGGETSAAVVRALGVQSLRVGVDLDPGVPRTESIGPDPVELVLKSGNFGAVDLFERAVA
jgi:uncharacterized protein YgbK (DUF1537 family)